MTTFKQRLSVYLDNRAYDKQMGGIREAAKEVRYCYEHEWADGWQWVFPDDSYDRAYQVPAPQPTPFGFWLLGWKDAIASRITGEIVDWLYVLFGVEPEYMRLNRENAAPMRGEY